MLIYEFNECTKKNRKCLTAAGRRIYQTAFAVGDVLPCLFLETKWLKTFGMEPGGDYFIPF